MAKTGKTPASSPSSSSSSSSSGGIPPVTTSSSTMSSAPPSKALELLGGSRRSTARTEDDIMKAVTSVKKEDRHKLSEEKRAKFHSYATKGMEDKFSLLVPSEGIEELSHVYSLALRVSKFQETLDSYDLSDVFNILPFQSDLSDIDEHGKVLNLLVNCIARLILIMFFAVRTFTSPLVMRIILWRTLLGLENCF